MAKKHEYRHRPEHQDYDAIITGGSSGLGAALALAYAQRGMSVLITGRREAALEQTCQKIEDDGTGQCRFVISDLSDSDQLQNLIATIYRSKNIRVLVNNAGFNVDGHFHDTPAEEFRAQMMTHMHAPTALIHAALPSLMRNRGDILNVSSLAAHLPTPNSPLYGPTKAYIASLSETLSCAYQRHGVRILTICPGFFRSDFHSKLGLDPDSFYRNRGLLRARTANDVAQDALNDLERGRSVSVSGWNYKLLYLLIKCLPNWLIRTVMRNQTQARP